jgi:hypothetical protein
MLLRKPVGDASGGWGLVFEIERDMNRFGPAGTGWMSSSSPDHIIKHEIVHALHCNGLGLDEFMHSPLLNGMVPQDEARLLRDKLSMYSTTNPREAVAEAVADLQGRGFHPEAQGPLAEILRKYGGANLWQNLGDMGLLKGLGLGLLGTLGVGAAQPQEV